MKILVVDDEPAIREIAGELLTNAGFEVLTAQDGEQAINLIKEKRPDLIVLDIKMPGMSGFQVVREIKKDPRLKDIPILIMSEVVSVHAAHFILHDLKASCFMSKAKIVTLLVSRVKHLLLQAA